MAGSASGRQLAEDPRVRKWDRTANGSKYQANPLYDPDVRPVDEFIDVGQFGKGKTHDFAQSRLAPAEGIWTGTLTFRSGLIAGEFGPEDILTADDVMDRRDLVPNMRLSLPHFAGGIVVFVNGVEHGPEESIAAVSTLPQTTMETWTAIERALEAKSKPGNTWSGHVRSSQVRNDEAKEWDTSSGWLGHYVELNADAWTEVKIPAGQSGIVQRIKTVLDQPAEHALILSQKPLSLAALNTKTAVSNPLTAPAGRPWYEIHADWFERRGVLAAWGTSRNPCGYGYSLKEDADGPTGEPLRSYFIENAGFNYETGSEPVLYLYVWQGHESNYLLAGRILRNQRTTDT